MIANVKYWSDIIFTWVLLIVFCVMCFTFVADYLRRKRK